MNPSWYDRLKWWLCAKAGHPIIRAGWIYNGHYHRDCRICGRITSERLRGNK